MTSVVAAMLAGLREAEGAEGLARREEELGKALAESQAQVTKAMEEAAAETAPQAWEAANQLLQEQRTLHKARQEEAAALDECLSRAEAQGADGETERLRRRLGELDAALGGLRGVTDLADGLQELDLLSPTAQPLDFARRLVAIARLVQECKDGDRGLEQAALPAIVPHVQVQRVELVMSLEEWWETAVRTGEAVEEGVWELCVADEVRLAPGRCRLAALRLLGAAHDRTEALGRSLLLHFFRPTLTHTTKLAVDKDAKGKRLRLSVQEAAEASEPLDQAEKSLLQLMELVKGLLEVAGKVEFPAEGEAEATTLLKALGKSELGRGLERMVVEDLLRPALPSQQGEAAERFQVLLDKAVKGAQAMKAKGLIPAGADYLASFGENLDDLLLKSRCAGIMDRARKLIRSQAHTLVQVGHPSQAPDEELALSLGLEDLLKDRLSESAKAEVEEETGLSVEVEEALPAVLRFPRCSVAWGVVELGELAERTLREAAEAESEKTAARLLLTARSIFDIFLYTGRPEGDVGPAFAAAFYNSAYYMAHKAVTLGMEARPGLAKHLKAAAQARSSFADAVLPLRHLASQSLEAHLGEREAILRETLAPATKAFAGGIVERGREEAVSRAFGATALQLSQVCSAWASVMSPAVYARSAGRLGSGAMGAVVEAVLGLEDVAVADAEFLAGEAAGLGRAVEAAFPDRTAVVHAGGALGRLSELAHCLQGSLASIQDRWAEGQGPLAAAFRPAELSRLIRALFQNTQRRAAFIASLHD